MKFHRIPSIKPCIAILLIPLLASCAAGDVQFAQDSPAGFWYGLWHGVIAPVSLVIHLFYDTVMVYELDNTPFRILLRAEVDILRDARVIDVQESEESISLTLTDKDPDAPGQITVILTKQPDLELAGWVTADAQGLETRVDVSSLSRPEKLDAKLFKRKLFFDDAFKQ